jgi:hypothetical protein
MPSRSSLTQLLMVLVLFTMASSGCAFIISPVGSRHFSSFIPHGGGWHCPPSRRALNDGIVPAKTKLLTHVNDSSESDKVAPDVVADSIRRRQLLFSLLAASGGTVARPVGPAQAETLSDTTIVAGAGDGAPVKIMKPPLDDRDYETIVLGNGLRVMLCSDPSSNEAAAAMDVHVGACSDPDNVPGLAHFCEHM